jgi:D-alanyl-D-alanine carboxypeptidase
MLRKNSLTYKTTFRSFRPFNAMSYQWANHILEEIMPSRVQTFFGIAIIALATTLVVGCSGSGSQPEAAEKLQASVDANWSQYKQEHGLPGGGMCVYLETPTGNYFASSGMQAGIDQNTHFRIASNTKTFTSAAIMLLDQQGKLHIDDTIVSLIPGQAVPYVPSTAQYNIPNKASITIPLGSSTSRTR